MNDIYHEILQKYWGYKEFRPLQLDIITSVGSGKDTLGLMPTGGGKSLTFQVPALARPGICLVITPLIALMNDQVDNLRRLGIKACAIHSGMSRWEIDQTYENCIYGDFKFLYISPERIGTAGFLERLKDLKVGLIAVDEAHCISQWGYDFRPSYRKIAAIREFLPDVPVLALTATATPEVVEDIQVQLKFPRPNLLKRSFERPNLVYVVRKCEDKEAQMVRILKSVEGSAIVYVRSRKKTRTLADLLTRNDISAGSFHAGMAQKTKNEVQDNWKEGKLRVMVATNAFGMGIDKADVRLVIHMDAPDSLEAYFQEAGRAGRDGDKSWAVFLWSDNDRWQLEKNMDASFPELSVVRKLYNSVCNFLQIAMGFGEGVVYDFNIAAFCKGFGYDITTLISSLRILQRAGYIDFSEMSDIPSRAVMLVTDYELHEFQISNPTLEPFIKVLLRSYTGLFTDYVSVDEELLASRLGATRDEVYQAFLKCSRMGVMKYVPQRQTPLIVLLQPRIEPDRLRFPDEVYKDRLLQYKKRIDSVISYAETEYICRSRQLLAYFGERNGRDCGHCDVCVSMKKVAISDDEYGDIENALKAQLEAGPAEPGQIVMDLGFDEEKIWKVVRRLEDTGTVYINKEGYLQLSQTEL